MSEPYDLDLCSADVDITCEYKDYSIAINQEGLTYETKSGYCEENKYLASSQQINEFNCTLMATENVVSSEVEEDGNFSCSFNNEKIFFTYDWIGGDIIKLDEGVQVENPICVSTISNIKVR